MALQAATRVDGDGVGDGVSEPPRTVRLVAGGQGPSAPLLAQLGLDQCSLERHRAPLEVCTTAGQCVDVATGKVWSARVDFELGGPLPMRFARTWLSTSAYRGPLGHGWHHDYDLALAVDQTQSVARMADGRVVTFGALDLGGSELNPTARLTLSRDGFGYALLDRAGCEHRFIAHRGARALVLSSLRNLQGHSLRFGYDDHARLVRVTDGADRVLELAYGREDRLVSITGPHPSHGLPRVVLARYVYDPEGNLIEVEDALCQAQRFSYEGGLLKQVTDRNGFSFHYAYDGSGPASRCVRSWLADGLRDYVIEYEGPVTMVRNSLGHISTYVHDGAVVRQAFDALGHVRTTEYGPGHRLELMVNELHQRTALQYDDRGNLIEVLGPDGARSTAEYTVKDRPARFVDPLGAEWLFTYDRRGRLRRQVDPFGHVTRYHYRGPWLLGVTDAAGNHTAAGHDAAGNLDFVAAPDGAVTRYEYDGWGRRVSVTDANANTRRRELDYLGRVVRAQEADATWRTFEYDAEGALLGEQHGLREIELEYAAPGMLISRSEEGVLQSFTYDGEQQLTGMLDALGEQVQYQIGPTGLVEQETRGEHSRGYTHDRAGRVMRVQYGDGRSSSYTYDAAGRVVRIQHSDGAIERYGYRPDGTLIMACNEHAVVMFERDALGRVVRERQDALWVDSAYDATGKRVRARSSHGMLQVIEHGARGEVARVLESATGFEARFTRDLIGLEYERALPGGLRARWERDLVGRPIEHMVELGDALLRLVQYRWTPDGRCMSKVGPRSSESGDYSDDAPGSDFIFRTDVEDVSLREVATLRLDSARPSARARVRARENAAGASRSGARCVFDAEGQLVEKRDADGAVWRFEWNVAGRLVRAQRDAAPEVTFGYDALGRRVWKRYRGQTTHWVWDRERLLHEWVEGTLLPLAECIAADAGPGADADAELALEAWLARDDGARGTRESPVTWLFEPSGLAPLARLSADACRTFVADDAGEPVLMTSGPPSPTLCPSLGAGAEPVKAVPFDRFLCPFRVGGRYEDAETGLQLDGLRYFDPETRRYLSREPRPHMPPVIRATPDPIWDTSEKSALHAPPAGQVGTRVVG